MTPVGDLREDSVPDVESFLLGQQRAFAGQRRGHERVGAFVQEKTTSAPKAGRSSPPCFVNGVTSGTIARVASAGCELTAGVYHVGWEG